MAAITNILFDFGNVLNDLDIDGARKRLAALRHPDKSEADFEREVMAAVGKYDTGLVSTELFINMILKQCGLQVQAIDVVDAWNSMLIGIPDYRLGLLDNLRSHYGTYILSNTNELHLNWVYEHLTRMHGMSGLEFETRFFDQVFYSHLIGLKKPDATAFKHVVLESLITPSKTLFIDDMQENIAAAVSLGFRAHHSPPDDEVANSLKLGGYY